MRVCTRAPQGYCCDAYNLLRHNGTLIITLFYLMLSCGIPELQSAADINWLVEKLMVRVCACARAFVCICDFVHASICCV